MVLKIDNAKKLESLCFYCHLTGIIAIFLGLAVAFMKLIDQDFQDIQVGLLIFIMGYAFVKISVKLQRILNDEKQ